MGDPITTAALLGYIYLIIGVGVWLLLSPRVDGYGWIALFWPFVVLGLFVLILVALIFHYTRKVVYWIQELYA